MADLIEQPSALQALALGLRQAGGVISPGAFQVIAQEDAQNAQLQRQIQLQKLQQELQDAREKALAGVVAPHLQKGDLEGAAAAAASSGVPGAAKLSLELMDKAEARKARALQAAELMNFREQQLNQTRDLALQRAQDQAERDRINAEFKNRELVLQAQMAEQKAYFQKLGIDLQAERVRLQQQQTTNIRVQQLGAALEKANLPEADAVIGAVEKALDSRPDLAEFLAGPKSLIPDVALPNDIAAGKQAFQKLFNITLKNRSGAAVTIPEFERLKAEFGAGVFKTPQQLRKAVEQARAIINKHYASVAGGFGKDVLDAYNQNVRGFGGNVVLDSQQKPETVNNDPLGIR